MSRYVVFSALLGSIILVTSLPMDIDSLDDDTFDIDIISRLQRTIKVQDKSDWQNIFQVHNTTELYNPSEVEELLFSSNLTAVPSIDQVGCVIRYTAGKRIKNDRLVARGADSRKWAKLMNVKVTLRYPTKGQGKKVTYMEIVADQSSKTGQARIIEGGIGQRVITTVLEAQNTYWLKYNVNIYGI